MSRFAGFAFLLAATLGAQALWAPVSATAQDYAQARLLFERGNQRYEVALRSRGPRRAQLLGEAIDAYLESFNLAPNRNVAFNLGATLEELDRLNEAFAFYNRYLAFADLSASEREQGTARRDALRPRIAILRVRSEPTGAEVRVGRHDVAASGTTPIEIAVPAGETQLLLSKAGYEATTISARAVVGERTDVVVPLEAAARHLVIHAPGGGRLSVDGRVVSPGQPIEVMPGPHVIRFEPAVEQTIEVQPGEGALEVDLRAAAAAAAPDRETGTLAVTSSIAAHVFVDGALRGEGTDVAVEVPAGPHHLRLDAAGHATAEARVDVRAGQRVVAEARLERAGAAGSTLGILPEITWAVAGVVGLVAVAFMARAFIAGGDYDDAQEDLTIFTAEREALRDETVRYQTVADVFGFTALGLAAAAFVLTLLDASTDGQRSTITVGDLRIDPALVPGGVGLIAAASWGGP
jgi:tetratricopeptide (TPR) repeat protein